MKIKHVQLGDFNLSNVHGFHPQKDIEVKWFQDLESKRANTTYASFIGDTKADINNQLGQLNNIISDRVRTLREIPKIRIIKTKVAHKPEMKEEIKEIY